MAKKDKNWGILKDKKYSETVKGRDVYSEQQMERGSLKEKQTMLSRNIIAFVISLLVSLMIYGGWCIIASTIEAYSSVGINHTVEGWMYDEEGNIIDNNGNIVYTAKEAEEGNISLDKIGKIGNIDWKVRSTSHLFASLIAGLMLFLVLQPILQRNLDAQNMLSDTSDINQYTNDQHIALPEEIQRKFNYFPDVGAHSSVQVSSLISHMALKNKGIKRIQIPKRYRKDILDEDGEVLHYAGEIIYDENDNVCYKEVPLFDETFADKLFEASGAPKEVRLSYDVSKIEYNPDNRDLDKLCGIEVSKALKDKFNFIYLREEPTMIPMYQTVADLINKDWEMPDYEPQRPAGAYIVDSSPVNTMVLAITRAGKGQTVIEPTIDMWMREKRPNNMVINDPKGELLVKNYVKGTVRGFQVIQFNLINSMKTDIYNPIIMAAQSSREGDFTKCAAYVENIAEVFFPLEGGDDPVWPNAANNAFKRAAYGLIDFYLEEERKYRNECNARMAKGEYVDPQVMEMHIDAMWGKVTLPNCYQMFTQLAGKKITNPVKEFAAKMKAGEYEGVDEDIVAADAERAYSHAVLWNGASELDCLTLYFNATDKLPRNSMRTLITNVNNSLKSMAGAQKMMASVYGIATTAMSFFTDPTIATLTSGTPSQTVDLAGLSFPRRLGVRFHPDFVKKNHYIGLRCKWDAFSDRDFKESLGKLFEHSDIVSREGWARYFFDGKFEKDKAYIRLQLVNASTDVLVHTYYFEFHKGYQTSLDGRTYTKDPILGTKIAKNGVLYELIPKDNGFEANSTTFKRKRLVYVSEPEEKNARYEVNDEYIPAITQSYVRYSEKPKMVFLVTPPHLMKYAKIILILIKQLVDLNFDQSYMTKANQKPLYKTRYMLEELGNLESEGHGISGFKTMLSIGLGQDQQFTLILQTLQQLRDIYGESVDKIVQGNTSNIIFLKSTDDSMMKTLETMSGITHKSFIDQKTVTRDMEKMFLMNEGKASYMMQTKEVPVISYNDMAFIEDRNSMVFRAGDSPIWNRNETILPMSYKMFENTIKVPGKDFSLQTIPTLSSAMDFDLKNNQPDFNKMLMMRMQQALLADKMADSYMAAFGYDENDIRRLDVDIYASDIMDMIDDEIRRHQSEDRLNRYKKADDRYDYDDEEHEESDYDSFSQLYNMMDNEEMITEMENAKTIYHRNNEKIYAKGMIAKSDLMNYAGQIIHTLDNVIIDAYLDIKGDMDRDPKFVCINGSLCDKDGTILIERLSEEFVQDLADSAREKESNVYADEEITADDARAFASYRVTDDLYRYLTSLPDWKNIAKGRFEDAVARRFNS